jgi:hypothetical protein
LPQVEREASSFLVIILRYFELPSLDRGPSRQAASGDRLWPIQDASTDLEQQRDQEVAGVFLAQRSVPILRGWQQIGWRSKVARQTCVPQSRAKFSNKQQQGMKNSTEYRT